MRNISFAITTRQFKDHSKDVTRRFGWWFLKAGDLLCGVEKSQGLKKGEKIVKLGVIRVISATPEPLGDITPADVIREGFPEMTPAEFIEMFCKSHKGVMPETIINRIEFEYLKGEPIMTDQPTTASAATDVSASAQPADARPTTIELWEFLRDNYAEKIRAKECQVFDADGDWVERINSTPIEGRWKVYQDYGDGEYYEVSSQSGSHLKFTVRWLDTTDPQPADAKAVSEAGDTVVPTYKDERWYGIGYNDGYEDAANIAREQYALVSFWTDKIAELQAANAALVAERDALLALLKRAEPLIGMLPQDSRWDLHIQLTEDIQKAIAPKDGE